MHANHYAAGHMALQVEVNGPGADALWVWLKQQQPAAGIEGMLGNDIKWNFAKFLLVDGKPVARYAPTTSPLAIEPDIIQHLKEL